MNKILQYFGICAGLLLMAGCIGGTSQPSVYYVLNASGTHAGYAVPGLDLGVGPITLPGILDRSQIVSRQGDNNLAVNEFHRWAEALDTQFTLVLAENLSAGLGTINIKTYPWERPFSPAYQVYVDVRRFDGIPGRTVVLHAMWWLVNTDDDVPVLTRRASLEVPTADNSMAAYVAAHNKALEKLSRDIATGIAGTLGSRPDLDN
ncbi:MAG: PqiC family protein [Desulfobacterales bacterium]|nr:PqiC family protein [Desulfobacterales bacterium]